MTQMRTFLPPNAADLFLRDLEQRADHPDAALTIGAVLHLSGAVPELLGLQEYVAVRLPSLPCLTHVLHGDGRQARWVPAVTDPAQHVAARHVGRGPESLEAAVQHLMRVPWPEGVPAWRLVLLHGHVPDGCALLYLTHHAVQDGGTIVAVLEALFGPDAAVGPAPAPRTPSAEPRPRLRQVRRSAAILLRHARKHHVWTSPVQPLSSRRRTTWARVPVALLKAAARAGGVGINDVYLTALGHAIAGWASTAWPRAARAPIPVMVPVSLRTADECAVPGNRLFLARVDLPGCLPPLAQRLTDTSAVTAALKLPGHRAVLRAVLTRLPAGLLRRLVAASTAPGRLTLVASFLVMRKRLCYGEAAVNRVDPVMCCPPGAPLAVVMLIYAGEASLCFRTDEALPEADTLPGLWRQALEDLSTTSGRPTTNSGAATAAGTATAPGRPVE
ncbi:MULTISPECIES: wax ester/triacylglycerol synthase domain-containing protein [unclassified Streptomyces]|uniref:wax ester/triacylglycerol synthase domain-containing protein n=1 Tax=unclassified Streptomyces TaxID=2593676 RepID=UPI001301317C|nr:wax ester/triacylglycerol synthase domain-containing protein [Streptomyces sp. CB02058]